jgi:hypothetical protein
MTVYSGTVSVNPLHAELDPICHLLILLRARHIFHVSGLRVKQTVGFVHFKNISVLNTRFFTRLGLVEVVIGKME